MFSAFSYTCGAEYASRKIRIEKKPAYAPPEDDMPPAVLPPTDADGDSVSSSDREDVEDAREDYEEALRDAADSDASSSDQEALEEAREEYEETYEEVYEDE